MNLNLNSQAALKALSAVEIDSRITLECVKALNELGSRNSVTFGWVPGHSNIWGNEIADELARAGSKHIMYRPEPACGISRAMRKRVLRDWVQNQARLKWRQSPGLLHSKELIKEFSTRASMWALQLSRDQLTVLTRALTDHCKLNKHMHRMGLTPLCRFCCVDAETHLHLLCDCDALIHTRSRALGGHKMHPQDVKALSSKKVIGYFTALGLIEDL